MKRLWFAALMTVASAPAAFASPEYRAPEIDGSAGLVALAIVGGVVALIRERSRA
ncbi:MAG: VPEID-CTERM sorting domain-containing protein [Hyphomicrobiales bacterium]